MYWLLAEISWFLTEICYCSSLQRYVGTWLEMCLYSTLLEMCWLIPGYELVHCSKCIGSLLKKCGSLLKICWLIPGYELAPSRKCVGSLLEKCGSFLEMCWLIPGDVLAHSWR